MSEFTLYMMLIFLPGIIAYKVFDELTEHKEHKVHEVIIYAFLFGCLSYLTYFIIFKIIFYMTGYTVAFYFPETLKDPKKASYGEIVKVSCIAFVVGFGITWFDTYKILHRIARWTRISKKFGEVDAFTFLLNSNLREKVWIIVRDKEDNLAFFGWVHTYSAGDEHNELFLVDVDVFDNTTGEKLMDSPGIFLSKPKEKYIIEFQSLQNSATMSMKTVRKAN